MTRPFPLRAAPRRMGAIAWRTGRGLRGLGDCPDIATLNALMIPGCNIVYDPLPGAPCTVQTWCQTQAQALQQGKATLPSGIPGWDFHISDPAYVASYTADAQQQLATTGQVNPVTAAALQNQGAPIPTAPVVSAAGTPIGGTAVVATATDPISEAMAWLQGSMSIAGVTVPNFAIAGGAAILLLLLMRKKR
jgi:hypothetical protein